MARGRRGSLRAAFTVTFVLAALGAGASAGTASAQLLDGVLAPGNPNMGTDAFASALPPLTGGTTRNCARSGRGFTVHCTERVTTMPSADPAASGVTFAHWIFCKGSCSGSLLTHELVHVRQFETYGDGFGPTYLAEAALHGDGCENKWEYEAYRATGRC